MRVQGPTPVPTGEQSFDVRVPATPRAVSWIRRMLGDLGLPPSLMDDARVLTTELVTNSIRHAGLRPEDRIRVRASWTGTRLRVDVFDRSGVAASHPVLGSIRPAPGAESGWGHYLIDRLASRWGSGRSGYWFELDREGKPGGP